MAHVAADRVQETTTSTGTGNLSLDGATTGFRTFASQLSDADTCTVLIEHETADEWEIAVVEFDSSAGELDRTNVLSSSDGGTAVSFAVGTKHVSIIPSATEVANLRRDDVPYDLHYMLGDPSANDEFALTAGRDVEITGIEGRADTAPAASITFTAAIDDGSPFSLFDVSDAGAVSASGSPFPLSLSAGETLTLIAPADMDGSSGLSVVLVGAV